MTNGLLDRTTHGGWCMLPGPVTAEVMGRSGFDWVCIDTQHGLIGSDSVPSMVQALALAGTPAVVRVPWNQPGDIMKALDAGAAGVIVPMVQTAQEAEQAVRACRYPPLGERSYGPIGAALRDDGFTTAKANDGVICAVQIETGSTLDELDAILSVPGIDLAYVGPADLGLSLGVAPTVDAVEPVHVGAIERIALACREHGVPAGIHCSGPEGALRWQELGFRFLTVATDIRLLQVGAQRAVDGVKRAG
ncbi:aldolase/citrate lyase family protein [Saccharopolyspora taberi]|uniref:Aldolase/citrate lyase family protein n=2 Tax=Saccharopolyspora taberi TaxID=60895 RepID=A0ABN3V9G1_9PSEU